jgi:hypothetical protein
MSFHVRDDELMDAVEGLASPATRQHVQACADCRERVAEAAGGWEMARAADVPEPSPLFWDAFRSQVGRRVGSERRWRSSAWVPALAAAAAVALAVGLGSLRGPRPAVTLPAWSASLPADEDAGLAQLVLDAGAAEEWAVAGCSGLADCLSGLSEEETIALTESLRADLEPGSDL